MIAPAAALEGCCTKARRLADPGTFVRLNTAGLGVPGAVAVTCNGPTCVLAVTKIPATPVPSVVTVVEPRNVTLAPLAGAEKVTATPGMVLRRAADGSVG